MEEKYVLRFAKLEEWALDNSDYAEAKPVLVLIECARASPEDAPVYFDEIRLIMRGVEGSPIHRGKQAPLPEMVRDRVAEMSKPFVSVFPIEETDPHKIHVVPRAEGGYWLVEEEDMIVFEDELRERERLGDAYD